MSFDWWLAIAAVVAGALSLPFRVAALLVESKDRRRLLDQIGMMRSQGRDPAEPRADHGRQVGGRGGVVVRIGGPRMPGAIAGDGSRHTETDRP